MAVARPVRALGLAATVLLFLIVFLLFRKPPEIKPSGPGDLEQEMPDDPMAKGD